MRRVIVAMTGASGLVLGVRTLQILATLDDVESHLIMSPSGAVALRQETDLRVSDVNELATVVHRITAIGDSIASGSFPVDAMIVTPCSIKTLSAIANSYSDNLITRAADVTLKEGRPLALVLRETPLHRGHLRLMSAASEAGAILMPPVPAFYPKPESVDEIVDHIARRALSRVGIPQAAPPAWTGLRTASDEPATDEPPMEGTP